MKEREAIFHTKIFPPSFPTCNEGAVEGRVKSEGSPMAWNFGHPGPLMFFGLWFHSCAGRCS